MLILVYKKTDDKQTSTENLSIERTIFVSKEHTADFQKTTGLQQILENNGNKDDIMRLLRFVRLISSA